MTRTRRFIRWTAISATVCTAFLTGTLGIDAISRLRMTTNSMTSFLPSHQSSVSKLIVIYRGMRVVTAHQVAPLLPLFDELGYDVLLVDSQGDRYDADRLAFVAATAITDQQLRYNYAEIVFDGISMGGVVAADTRLLLEEQGAVNGVRTRLILDNAPFGIASLQGIGKVSWVLSSVPFGVIWNRTPIMSLSLVAPPPRESDYEEGVDRASIERSVDLSRTVPMSRWRDELHSFTHHRWYQPGELGLFDEAVFIWSEKDTNTVDLPVAHQLWSRFIGQEIKVIKIDAPHASPELAPQAYEHGYRIALEEED